ncbi:uncharacterized protein LOC123880201 [Maniola jurtina]|uniref:uncharacterized protein LOC123880201 n=1 Tax=Maniola jurtina TaxID=191418 RepID=UPI001E685EBB|nr:uncharacterized protein LOC123880201 [Maniola jurtina]
MACSGIRLMSYDYKAIQLSDSRGLVLALRLITLMILVALLTLHLRSVKVFRWEYSVTGGLLVAYCIAVAGLALCAGIQNCGGTALQVYLCATGGTMLAVNAAAIWRRWQKAGELTRIVADLLAALGVMLKRQLTAKVFLSVVASVVLLLDLFLTAILKFITTHR